MRRPAHDPRNIYYIGQTIAVLAILGSLGAIWVQLRKDHTLARAEGQRELLDGIRELSGYPANDPTAFESIRACMEDYSGATPFQQVQFNHAAVMAVNIAESSHYLLRDELAFDVSSGSLVDLALAYIVTPGGQQWWQAGKMAFGTDIREELDRNLRERDDIVPLWDAFAFYRPEAGQADAQIASSKGAD